MLKTTARVLLILALVCLGIAAIQYLGVIKVWTVLMVLTGLIWGCITLLGSYFLFTYAFPGVERTIKRWLGRGE